MFAREARSHQDWKISLFFRTGPGGEDNPNDTALVRKILIVPIQRFELMLRVSA
ncbi:hypothetical protein ASZ90_015980 [hydrocarbon metagenome]|jgi:hypothetical protein|uniref:Uncharacterized protein n=1 Tax=hydrocarbon metagenome TaxID=938273 RepID=A0A0W8F1Z9_9ZZZZ